MGDSITRWDIDGRLAAYMDTPNRLAWGFRLALAGEWWEQWTGEEAGAMARAVRSGEANAGILADWIEDHLGHRDRDRVTALAEVLRRVV